MILELKKAECQRRGLHFDGPINTWDPRYYMNQGEETRYHEDQYLLNESFPMQVVTRGLLCIPQELLGLTFDLEEGTNVCHEDVWLYTVRDAVSGKVIHWQVLPGPLPSVRACVWEPVGRGPELLCGSWASPRVPPQGREVRARGLLRPAAGLPAARWEPPDRHRGHGGQLHQAHARPALPAAAR